MWKEQLLLLALLAALFLPFSTQNPFKDDEIDEDHCHVKTSIVLHKLDTFEREKIKDDFKRNQLWTDVVKETIGVMMKEQQEQSKSQVDQFTNKLDKTVVDVGQKVEEKIGAMLKQQLEEYKSQFDLLANKLEKVEKMEETLELVKTRVQQNAHLIKLIPECERWLQTAQNLNKRNFFNAEGKYFYFNKTKLNWNGAREWCVKKGMQMAILKTTSQMDAVNAELIRFEAVNKVYWLDASDVGPFQTTGQFRWVDGTLVDGTTWHKGKIYKQYGNLNETTCVNFNTGIARLVDGRCSWDSRILCQVPAALAACL